MPRDEKGRQRLVVRDFRPGIFTRKLYGGGAAKGPVPAPTGAAQYGTYGCLGLPTGGLCPLPKKVTTFSIPDPDTGNYKTGTPVYVGLGSLGPINTSPASQYPDELFVGIEWITAGTNVRRFREYRLRSFDSPYGTENLQDITTTSTSPPSQFWGQTWASSRMSTASPYTAPGTAVYVTEWSEAGLGGVKYLWCYPNPVAPTSSVMSSTILSGSTNPATSRPGQLIGHQNRIVLLEDINNAHPSTNNATIPTNEQISFTDPANSNTAIGTQKQVFVAEYPNGYGAWGSISAGELFLVKNQGGGVIVSGDIANPAGVIRLPGVVSTGAGNAYYKAASTNKGLFYLTTQQGAWVWRGADTSEKISDALDDNFAVTSGSAATINVRGQLSEWADWVCFPGGWLYDTVTGSWFFLEDPTGSPVGTYDYFTRSFSARYMYAMSASQTPGTAVVAVYDRQTPRNDYYWDSHRILLDQNHVADVREVTIMAQGTPNATVSVRVFSSDGTGGTSSSVTFTLSGANAPEMHRLPVSCRAASIEFDIYAVGALSDEPAPVVHEVIIDYDTRMHAAA